MLNFTDGTVFIPQPAGQHEARGPARPLAMLLEDDLDYAMALRDYLSNSGFEVEIVVAYPALTGALRDHHPSVLVVDQFVSGVDMGERLEVIRGLYSGPVVMLTGNDDPVDRVICLERGADDFIIKANSSPREVLARLRAIMRRAPGAAEVLARPALAVETVVDGWVLLDRNRTLTSPDGEVVRLTGAERDMFWMLMSRRGTVVPRDEAMEVVLRRKSGPNDRSIDNLVSRCRRFVAQLGGNMDIETVRGVGYKLIGFSRDRLSRSR